LVDLPEGGEPLEPFPCEPRAPYLKQVVRDALWSDPRAEDGIDSNPRGAGVSFGPDITRAFLKKNNLKMVVRSHECVRTGFDQPFPEEDDKGMLCTIFSASNYGGGGNGGAFMLFTTKPPVDPSSSSTPRTHKALSAHLNPLAGGLNLPEGVHKVDDVELYYEVVYYHVDESAVMEALAVAAEASGIGGDGGGSGVAEGEDYHELDKVRRSSSSMSDPRSLNNLLNSTSHAASSLSLEDMVIRKKSKLNAEFLIGKQ
jgi:hypothetical protein